MTERFQNVFERVRLHVLAHAAAANEGLVRKFVLHASVQAAFGQEQERRTFGLFLDVAHHLAGAAHVVAEEGDARVAFGVAHHLEARILTAEKVDELGIVGLVNVAAAAVEHDFFLDAALLHLVNQVLAHEAIRHEHDLVVFEARDNLHHVAAGDAHVAVRFHVGGGVCGDVYGCGVGGTVYGNVGMGVCGDICGCVSGSICGWVGGNIGYGVCGDVHGSSEIPFGINGTIYPHSGFSGAHIDTDSSCGAFAICGGNGTTWWVHLT